MTPSIKIKVDPKKRFGVSAKPGEITFGTHAHLNHFNPQSEIELRLLIAQKKMKKANERMKNVKENRSIKTMLETLNATKATKELASTQKMALLSNYKELKALKAKTKDKITAKRYQQRAEQTYRKVRQREDILGEAQEFEEILKEHLTIALRNNKKKVRIKKPKIFTEKEKKEADQLLDTKILYAKRKALILEKIKRGKLSKTDSFNLQLALNDTDLSLEDTNRLLRKLVNNPKAPKQKRPKK